MTTRFALYRLSKYLLVFLLLSLVFQGCGRRTVPLIPREVLFGNPDIILPKLSPDGKYLTYLAPHNGVLNIWIRTLGQTDDRPLTGEGKSDIYHYMWFSDGRQIIYTFDKNRDANRLLYAVDIADGKVRNLITRKPLHDIPVQAEILKTSIDDPDKLLFMYNDRDPGAFDLYELDIKSGDITLLEKSSPTIFDWLPDHQGVIRGYTQAESDGGQSMMLRDNENQPFHKEVDWGLIDDSSWPLAFHPDNRRIYLRDSRDLNATALVLYDPKTRTREIIAQDPHYDMESILIDPRDDLVKAVRFSRDDHSWEAIGDELKGELEYLYSAQKGKLYIADTSKDFSKWLVAFIVDDGPITYYYFDRENKTLEKLFVHRKALLNLPLAKQQPFKITARDGITISGFITLPLNFKGPSPAIVIDTKANHVPYRWGYQPEVQWLANRGFVCLQVNHRGKMGFGKEFQNLGNREMGGKILDDINDAVQWSIDKQYTDPEKVSYFGISMGAMMPFVP